MLDRLLSAVVAISLAFLVWLYARCRDQEMLDNVPIPVQVSLSSRDAAHFDLETTGPAQVPVSFVGPPSRVREVRGMVQRGEVEFTVSVNVPADRASEPRMLDTVRVNGADLHLPAGVRATVAEGQNRLPIVIRKLAERSLPVRLDHNLEDRLGSCQIEPATVVVRGPVEVIERLQSLPTRPFAPPARAPGLALQEVVARSAVKLVDEIDGRPLQVTPAEVNVRLTLRPRRKQYEIQVPVFFLTPANFGLRPVWGNGNDTGTVRLKVLGPPSEEPIGLCAFVDLTGREFQATREPGQQLYADEPLRVQLPRDYQLAQPPPRSGTFRLVPIRVE